MGRLFVLFFVLPWWAYVPMSIGVLWVGERVYEQGLESEAEKAVALGAAAPAPVDLGEFDRDRDIHAADEVHVVGLIDHDLDYELVERTNGVPTSTRYLYMIFGPDDFGSNVVRAALMLDKREEAQFLETKADEWAIDATADYWVYGFNGFAKTSATLDELADGAIEEQGLTKAADFIYIQPFFEGREVALTPRGVPQQTRYIGWAIAALVALIGVVKRVRSVRARLTVDADDALEPENLDEIEPAPSTEFTAPSGVSDNTPLGRLVRRNAGATAALQDDDLAYARVEDPEPELSYSVSDLDEDTYGAQPAHADEIGGSDAGQPPSAFPPVGEIVDRPAAREASSALAYYLKLGLAMLVVGVLAYDPSLFSAALPVGAIALFWFGVYVVVRKMRRGAVQPVAAGSGGPGIDLTAPVRSGRQERGVI